MKHPAHPFTLRTLPDEARHQAATLDALSRTRALTEGESVELEHALHSPKMDVPLIPVPIPAVPDWSFALAWQMWIMRGAA